MSDPSGGAAGCATFFPISLVSAFFRTDRFPPFSWKQPDAHFLRQITWKGAAQRERKEQRAFFRSPLKSTSRPFQGETAVEEPHSLIRKSLPLLRRVHHIPDLINAHHLHQGQRFLQQMRADGKMPLMLPRQVQQHRFSDLGEGPMGATARQPIFLRGDKHPFRRIDPFCIIRSTYSFTSSAWPGSVHTTMKSFHLSGRTGRTGMKFLKTEDKKTETKGGRHGIFIPFTSSGGRTVICQMAHPVLSDTETCFSQLARQLLEGVNPRRGHGTFGGDVPCPRVKGRRDTPQDQGGDSGSLHPLDGNGRGEEVTSNCPAA